MNSTKTPTRGEKKKKKNKAQKQFEEIFFQEMNEFGFLLKTGIINNTCKQASKEVSK
jgi:hypothetical protein